jgi:hypothetical protein
MSEPLLAASILSALAAALHGGLGETAIFPAAVRTPLPNFSPQVPSPSLPHKQPRQARKFSGGICEQLGTSSP